MVIRGRTVIFTNDEEYYRNDEPMVLEVMVEGRTLSGDNIRLIDVDRPDMLLRIIQIEESLQKQDGNFTCLRVIFDMSDILCILVYLDLQLLYTTRTGLVLGRSKKFVFRSKSYFELLRVWERDRMVSLYVDNQKVLIEKVLSNVEKLRKEFENVVDKTVDQCKSQLNKLEKENETIKETIELNEKYFKTAKETTPILEEENEMLKAEIASLKLNLLNVKGAQKKREEMVIERYSQAKDLLNYQLSLTFALKHEINKKQKDIVSEFVELDVD